MLAGRTRPAQTDGKLGDQKDLLCSHNKDCPWKATYEYSQSGWVLTGGLFQHNHPLETSKAKVMSTANGRVIPPEFMEFGEILSASGQTASDIMKVFHTLAARRGVDETWVYQDVYNAFQRTGGVRKDAKGFIELLVNRERSDDLQYFAETDERGGIVP